MKQENKQLKHNYKLAKIPLGVVGIRNTTEEKGSERKDEKRRGVGSPSFTSALILTTVLPSNLSNLNIRQHSHWQMPVGSRPDTCLGRHSANCNPCSLFGTHSHHDIRSCAHVVDRYVLPLFLRYTRHSMQFVEHRMSRPGPDSHHRNVLCANCCFASHHHAHGVSGHGNPGCLSAGCLFDRVDSDH